MSSDAVTTMAARSLPRTLALENVSPATRLLEKRRQMFEVQEALELQKQDFAAKDAAFRAREEALRARDLELQASLIRFSRFLQDNDTKRALADKRAADEARARGRAARKAGALADGLGALRAQRDAGRAVLEQHLRFTRYLEGALEASDDAALAEPADLVARHAALAATHARLDARRAAAGTALDAARGALTVQLRARSDEALALHNRLTAAQGQLEALVAAAREAQSGRDRSLAAAAARTLVHGQLLAAADGLHTRVREVSAVTARQRNGGGGGGGSAETSGGGGGSVGSGANDSSGGAAAAAAAASSSSCVATNTATAAAAAVDALQQLEVVGNYLGDLLAITRQLKHHQQQLVEQQLLQAEQQHQNSN